MSIEFKEASLGVEFFELQAKNPRLHRLINLLHDYTMLEFNKGVVITHIFRTPEQQKELYKDTPADKRPTTSPHMTWGAVDIRSSIYDAKQIDKMLKFLNTFTYAGGQRSVAIHHMVAGNTWHTHIQYA